MRDRVAVAGLILLAVLAVLGKSGVMLTSVLGMGAAFWAMRSAPMPRLLAAVGVTGLASSLLAEVVHTLYHWLIPASAGPGDSGAFFVSATLVGLINVAAFAGLLLLSELATRRAESARRA